MKRNVRLINYANGPFLHAQKTNTQSAKSVGGVIDVREFGPKDIPDEFRKANIEIFKHSRGGGYWLWKPFFVYKNLQEINDGECLIYCDSGCRFISDVQSLLDLQNDHDIDVMSFELTLLEKHWTKRDLFLLLNCDSPEFTDTYQRLASFFIIRKTKTSLMFAEEFLELSRDRRAITDDENELGSPNYEGFREHRHDQSIISLLTKKNGYPAFRDPTQYGNSCVTRYEDRYPQILDQHRKANWPVLTRIRRKIKYSIENVRSGKLPWVWGGG